jgi:GTP cyclohydrolase I
MKDTDKLTRGEIIESIDKLSGAIKKANSECFREADKLLLAGALYKLFMEVVGIEETEDSKGTPYRVAKMFISERCEALYTVPPVLTLFPGEDYEEYIVVRDIPYISMCSHHHVVFQGQASIAYFPDGKIVGLSKFARVVNYFSAKPQVQENLTVEIAKYLWESIQPQGLAVKLEGEHLCLSTRGVKASGSRMVTQQFLGEIDKREVENLWGSLRI